MNTLETAQVLFVSCDTTNDITCVKLNHFVACARAAVLNFTTNPDVCTVSNRWSAGPRAVASRDFQIAVSKACITQAVSEIVESAVDSRFLTFPLCLGLGRKIEWDLSDRLRESHRQFSAGVVVAKKYIGDCSSALHTGKPCFQNSGHVLVDPVDAHGATIYKDHHDWFARRIHRLHQFQLMTGKVEAG